MKKSTPLELALARTEYVIGKIENCKCDCDSEVYESLLKIYEYLERAQKNL